MKLAKSSIEEGVDSSHLNSVTRLAEIHQSVEAVPRELILISIEYLANLNKSAI